MFIRRYRRLISVYVHILYHKWGTYAAEKYYILKKRASAETRT